MADIKSCDLCGASPANQVEVALILHGVVIPGQPTATSEVLDACPACQERAVDLLAAHAKETMREQAPFQRQMLRHAADRDEAQEAFNREVKPTLELFADGLKDVPATVAARRDELLATVERHEARRLTVFGEAAKAHDARASALRRAAKG